MRWTWWLVVGGWWPVTSKATELFTERERFDAYLSEKPESTLPNSPVDSNREQLTANRQRQLALRKFTNLVNQTSGCSGSGAGTLFRARNTSVTCPTVRLQPWASARSVATR